MVLAWNGLAVAALAETGALLGRPDLVEAARRCADLLVAVHLDDHGRWHRVSRDGTCGAAGAVLEDLGDLAEGLFVLAGVTGETSWATVALGVLDQVLDEFTDDDGALLDTSRASVDPRLGPVGRPADPTDNAYPSGTSAAAGALLTAAALTGETRWRAAAERAVGVAGAVGRAAPRFGGWGLAVAEALVAGPLEVAVVGEPDDPAADALHAAALASPSPGLVVAARRAGRTTACRCWPTGRSWTARRRRTCAAASCASGRRPTRPGWPGRWGRRWRRSAQRGRGAGGVDRVRDGDVVHDERRHRQGVEHLVEAEPAR